MNVSKTLQLALLLCGTFSISETKAMEGPEERDLNSLSIACKERGFEIINEATSSSRKIRAQMCQEAGERMRLVKARKTRIQNKFDAEFNMLGGTTQIDSDVVVKACMLVTPAEFSDILTTMRAGNGINVLTGWGAFNLVINNSVQKYIYHLNQNELEGKEAYERSQQNLHAKAIVANSELDTFYGEGEKPMLRTHFFSLASDLNWLSKKASCANPQEIKDRMQKDTDSILGNVYASDKDRELATTVRKFLDL